MALRLGYFPGEEELDGIFTSDANGVEAGHCRFRRAERFRRATARWNSVWWLALGVEGGMVIEWTLDTLVCSFLLGVQVRVEQETCLPADPFSWLLETMRIKVARRRLEESATGQARFRCRRRWFHCPYEILLVNLTGICL